MLAGFLENKTKFARLCNFETIAGTVRSLYNNSSQRRMYNQFKNYMRFVWHHEVWGTPVFIDGNRKQKNPTVNRAMVAKFKAKLPPMIKEA